jgi:hypothetical protein
LTALTTVCREFRVNGYNNGALVCSSAELSGPILEFAATLSFLLANLAKQDIQSILQHILQELMSTARLGSSAFQKHMALWIPCRPAFFGYLPTARLKRFRPVVPEQHGWPCTVIVLIPLRQTCGEAG